MREAIQALLAAAARASPGQMERADAQLERLHAAATVLGIPRFRAGHDAERGNFRGVARCLQAGLTVDELNGLHAEWVRRRPEEARQAQARARSGQVFAAAGRPEAALEEYRAALALDPVSLELQRSYWALKRATPRPEARR